MSEEVIFVVYVPDIEAVRDFFTGLGLEFIEEKHGDGPRHYSCQKDNLVFEIYPTKLRARAAFL